MRTCPRRSVYNCLAQVLLDRAVLPLGRMELLPDCEGATAGTDGDGGSPDGANAGPEFVRMDASALENLEVLYIPDIIGGFFGAT